MKWICDNNVVSDEDIQVIEEELQIVFPKDFVANIKKYDGGYPKPNKITVEGQEEVLNNLVSFLEGDRSFILNIIRDIENFRDYNLVPIAEDPFGNLFCYFLEKMLMRLCFGIMKKVLENMCVTILKN